MEKSYTDQKNRIFDKIEQIEEDISLLKEIAPDTFEEYKSSKVEKPACERQIERIMEAVTDIAFYLIKIKKLKRPEDDSSSYFILSDSEIISKSLAENLKSAKGMKNFITHQYDKIDDEIVFNSIKTQLEKDVREFIVKVREILNGNN